MRAFASNSTSGLPVAATKPAGRDVPAVPVHPADRAVEQRRRRDAGLEVEVHRLRHGDLGRRGAEEVLVGVELVLDLGAVGQRDAERDFRDLVGGAEDVAEAPVVVALPVVAAQADRGEGRAGEGRLAAEARGAQAPMNAEAPVDPVADEAGHLDRIGFGLRPGEGEGRRVVGVVDADPVGLVEDDRGRPAVTEVALERGAVVGDRAIDVAARDPGGVAALDVGHHRAGGKLGVAALLEDRRHRLPRLVDAAGPGAERHGDGQGGKRELLHGSTP